eukprot:scaffold252159_cov33-Prasinocladus_malaysianus.AAC.1
MAGFKDNIELCGDVKLADFLISSEQVSSVLPVISERFGSNLVIRSKWEVDMRNAVISLVEGRDATCDAVFGLLRELAFSNELYPEFKPNRFSSLALALHNVMIENTVSDDVFSALQADVQASIDALLRTFAAQYEPAFVAISGSTNPKPCQFQVDQKCKKAVMTLCAKSILKHIVLPLIETNANGQNLSQLKAMLLRCGTDEELMREDVAETRAGLWAKLKNIRKAIDILSQL